ncbi:Uncharacterised protein [uncultured archaeon]|nr:Uncharacterised protein [uncultured archaeon]
MDCHDLLSVLGCSDISSCLISGVLFQTKIDLDVLVNQLKFKYEVEREEVYDEIVDMLDWHQQSRDFTFTTAFLERHQQHVWDIKNTVMNWLTEEFVEKHIDHFDISKSVFNFDWVSLCSNKHLTDVFWERHISKVPWRTLSESANITEAFVDRHANQISWQWLCRNPNFNEEFWERHLDKVSWGLLYVREQISREFIIRHLNLVREQQLPVCYQMILDYVKTYHIPDKLPYIHEFVPQVVKQNPRLFFKRFSKDGKYDIMNVKGKISSFLNYFRFEY